MKNKPKQLAESFGKRIATFRNAKGLTQAELGAKIGCSQRVIAYYECETKHIPSNLLLPLAKALRISLDELIGVKEEDVSSPQHIRLWRKLKQAELLPPKDQKAIVRMIEALLKDSQSKNGTK
jgi:transcriptional regulator with XRE-family HTH domain